MRTIMLLAVIGWTGLSGLARTAVWQVEKGERKVLFAGTCHCLSEKDYPLPDEFQRAYDTAEMIVFECDLGVLESPEAQMKLQRACGYTDGTTLKDHLSKPVYDELAACCASNNVPLKMFASFKPPMVLLALMFTELRKVGIEPGWGVDVHFHKRALKDKKREMGLESVEDQIRYVSTMADGMEDDFVRYSLQDLKATQTKFREIITNWRAGDSERLNALLQEEMASQFTSLSKRLLKDRNVAWLPQIERLFATPEVELVMVGTGHLVGPDSVLKMLEKRGYTVRFLQ